jgi:hypothetical protein
MLEYLGSFEHWLKKYDILHSDEVVESLQFQYKKNGNVVYS